MMSEWYTRSGYMYYRDNTSHICVQAHCVCEAQSKIIRIAMKHFSWETYYWLEYPWKVVLSE